MKEESQHKIKNMQQKINLLERSVESLTIDVNEVKQDVKQFRQELCSWFDRLDSTVQDLRVSNTKLEEQMVARTMLENAIKDELKEAKKVRSKLLLGAAGGAVSVIGWLIQDIFSK